MALGFGFRCGFLGMLHMEVIQERLEREFDLDLVTTLPSVIYHVYKTDGTMVAVDNPHNYPDPAVIEHAEEPYVKVNIIAPNEFVGNIMPMCQDRRGEFKDMQYLDTNLVELHYQMPLNEIIYDFFDALKANTKGYASLDYELSGYRPSELVKVDLKLNGEMVDALSFIAHKDKAYPRARRLCEKLKENIPRQLFEVPVQAAIGGRVIARETVKAMRKDVLAKCYGGDITRKKKLLEKQKEGKKENAESWALSRSPRRRFWRCSSWTSDAGRSARAPQASPAALASCAAEIRLPLPEKVTPDPHVLQLRPGTGAGRRLVQVVDLRPLHGQQEGGVGGQHQLAAEEPGGVLQKALQLQLHGGGEAVLRLVQKVQGVLSDGLGEKVQGALSVGPLLHIFHQVLPEKTGLGHGLGVRPAAPALVVVQGPEDVFPMPVRHILVQQPGPGGVDARVDAADIQQVVEHIVAGDDPALPAGWRRARCGRGTRSLRRSRCGCTQRPAAVPGRPP